tara:strand:+ start:370 stop:696 length:327 start_codon:yes stop_codon:yes gene_type:complete
MAKEDRKYVIIPLAEVEDVDFNQVMEDSARTLRLSEDGEYTFVKFEGDTPSFLEGKTQYTHAEIKAIANDPDGIWYVDSEEAKTWNETIRGALEKITWKSLNPFSWFS